MINCAANVVRAKYKPLTRRDGKPKIIPIAAAVRPEHGNAIQKDKPNVPVMRADV